MFKRSMGSDPGTVAAVLLILIVFAWSGPAWAHPYASRYFGHQVEVYLERDQVAVTYTIEIPTTRVLKRLGETFEGRKRIVRSEERRFHRELATEVARGLVLVVDDQPLVPEVLSAGLVVDKVNWAFVTYQAEIRAKIRTRPRGTGGTGGGEEADASAEERTPPETRKLELRNGNFPDEPSVFASEIRVSEDLLVLDCSLWDVEEGRIRKNRTGMWRMEESNREIYLEWKTDETLGARAGKVFRRIAGADPAEGEASFRPASDRFVQDVSQPLSRYIKSGETSPLVMILALGMAVFFGGAHALTPGHGKALVASYLVGARGTVRHAVLLGLVVTFTHTASVFVLGGIALGLTDVVAPEVLFPWIEMASGVTIGVIGVVLIRRRLGVRQGAGESAGDVGGAPSAPSPADHPPPHGSHDHAHDHPGNGHHHHHHPVIPDRITPRTLVALGVSGGMVPCPSALVVLLTAIAFHRILFGLALVTAFSVGLSVVLVAVGIVVVFVGNRVFAGRGGRLLRVLPLASALLICVIGLGIVARAGWSVVTAGP